MNHYAQNHAEDAKFMRVSRFGVTVSLLIISCAAPKSTGRVVFFAPRRERPKGGVRPRWLPHQARRQHHESADIGGTALTWKGVRGVTLSTAVRAADNENFTRIQGRSAASALEHPQGWRDRRVRQSST